MKKQNRITILPLFSLLFLLASGCATQGSLDTVHQEIDTISPRLYSTEKELGNTRQEFSDRLTLLEQRYKSDSENVHKLLANIQANLDSSRLDMQAQNGKIDDLSQPIKKMSEDLRRYREDDDKRIFSLEDRIVKLQTAVDDLTKKNSEAAQQKVVPPTPESIYMKGMDTFKAGDVAAARDIFQNFLDLYPQHALAANAVFWIAESYYNEKNFEQAILKYQDVIKNYPQAEKIPAAMLKQGMAFNGIKDAESAKYVLKKLVKTFPKSEEAKNARELLKKNR